MTGGQAEIALDAEAIGQPHQGDFAKRKEPEFGTAEPHIGEADPIRCGIYERRFFPPPFMGGQAPAAEEVEARSDHLRP